MKVPITFTNQDFTTEVIKKLIELKIKLNITAIFTLQQVEEILPIINDTETIISVFAGRIYDCGLDASKIMEDISKKLKKDQSKCKLLWASPRMSYDFLKAIETGSHIITMQSSQIQKLKSFGKKLEDYSLETVKQFFNDANSSGYKI